MTDVNKFKKQRLAYLKSQDPQLLKVLEEDGVLEIHLVYAQKRADWHMDQLVMAGMNEVEAEEIVVREMNQP